MQKIKLFIESEGGKTLFIILIVILTGLGSFELGRLSKNTSLAGIKIEYKDTVANVVSASDPVPESLKITSTQKQTAPTDGKNFVASSRGSKYYPVSCSAGKKLKMENRIYFKTSSEAEAAGYTLSASCK